MEKELPSRAMPYKLSDEPRRWTLRKHNEDPSVM
jgi:hypothetical protein